MSTYTGGVLMKWFDNLCIWLYVQILMAQWDMEKLVAEQVKKQERS